MIILVLRPIKELILTQQMSKVGAGKYLWHELYMNAAFYSISFYVEKCY